MAEEKITFHVLEGKPMLAISLDAEALKTPIESYMAEAQWNNARANVDLGDGRALSAHMDINGNNEITKLEFRQLDSTAKFVAGNVPTPPGMSSLTTPALKIPAQEGGDEVIMSRKGLKEKYLAQANEASLLGLKDSNGNIINEADVIKHLESEIDKLLGDKHPLGIMYKPDGKLTEGEVEYFRSFVVPQASGKDNSISV